jgi:hypothetical protein
MDPAFPLCYFVTFVVKLLVAARLRRDSVVRF